MQQVRLQARTIAPTVSSRTTLFPGEEFEQLLQGWLSREPTHSDKISAAALKDTLALLETKPHNLASIPCDLRDLDIMEQTVADTASFLKKILRPLSSAATIAKPEKASAVSKVVVQSPLAGGVLHSSVGSMRNTPASEEHSMRMDIAILNPGRCGFSSVDGSTVLWWRLWQVAVGAREQGVQMLVLPSPRLPPGTQLPPGFPYAYHGHHSTEWQTVGIFVLPEVEPALEFPNISSSKRREWILARSADKQPPIGVCAVYGPLDDKFVFWQELLNEWTEI